MPIYEYRCEQGHEFEVTQRMSDDPVDSCQSCDARVHRVFRPIAVHFKGSGFYNTDYGTRKRQREQTASGEGGSSESKSSESSESSDSKSSEPKSSESKSSESKSSESKSSESKSETKSSAASSS